MSDNPNHSTGPSRQDDAMRYERISICYLDAHDRDDLDTMAKLWREAETDSRLEQILCELNEGLLHESRVAVDDFAREKVIQILHQGMPSAIAEVSALTIADVAAAIRADQVTYVRLSMADRVSNEKLLTVHTTLPPKLDGAAIMALTSELPITASQRYWRAFQQAGILLNMSRASAGRAAARQARPLRSSKRDDKEES